MHVHLYMYIRSTTLFYYLVFSPKNVHKYKLISLRDGVFYCTNFQTKMRYDKVP